VRIKGEFPRVKPRYAREEVTDAERDSLKTQLRTWVDKFFDREANTVYFENLIDVVAVFTAYINPFHELGSSEMDLAMKTFFWMWHTDDVLEMAIERNIPFSFVDQALYQFIGALRGKAKLFADVQGCPGFRKLFNSAQTIHESFEKHSFSFEDISEPFIEAVQRYYAAMRWYSVERIEGAYSEETFKYWRRTIAFLDIFGMAILMLHRVKIPNQVLISPSFIRIHTIANSMAGFTNDVLGLSKEFKYGQRDNFLVFKVLQKQIPIQQAVSEVCTLIENELEDYLMLRDAMLYEFSHHPILVKYVDILEAMIDGHNKIYLHSQRHLSAGKVRLTR